MRCCLLDFFLCTFGASVIIFTLMPVVGDINDPEEINAKNAGDAQPFESAFGEFVTRCLFSGSWQLRCVV